MSIYPFKKSPANMGLQNAQIFNFLEFDPDEHELNHDEPDMTNVFAAAIYVAKLLQAAGFQYALLGGCALVALGAPRKTFDADIATNATMADLWKALDDSRLYLPDTKQIADTMRLFVKTGPEFEVSDYGGVLTEQSLDIPVDVMVAGSFSIPRKLEDHIQMVTFDVGEVAVGFAILSTSLLLRAKLNAFSAREARKDFENIVFILDNLDLLVADIAGLDSDTRQDFVESDSFLQLNEGSQQGYMETLQVSRLNSP